MEFKKSKQKKQKGKEQPQEEEKKVSTIPKSIFENSNEVFLTINAKPNSKLNQISDITDEGIDINIAAPPKDNEANNELKEFMSCVLKIKKSLVNLDKGSKSRAKIISIDLKESKLNIEQIYNLLKQSMGNQ